MSTQETSVKPVGVFGRIVGIFTSPRETFVSIEQKPTWIVPFLIGLVFLVVFQFLTLEIQAGDRVAMMEAQDRPAEQIDAVRSQMDSPLKYIGLVVGPIAMLVVWAILAGIILFTGNTIMGGQGNFKKLFSMVGWSSLVGILGGILHLLLILPKGTSHGVTTSLAILLPTPPLGETPFLYRLLTKFDVFTIWNLVLWIIGISVIYRFTMKKSATLVLSLWALWIIASVALGSVLGNIFG